MVFGFVFIIVICLVRSCFLITLLVLSDRYTMPWTVQDGYKKIASSIDVLAISDGQCIKEYYKKIANSVDVFAISETITHLLTEVYTVLESIKRL